MAQSLARTLSVRGALVTGTLALLVALPTHTATARAAQPAQPRVIEVVARRFAFEPAVIEVTEGEPVRLVVTSADGVHGLQIKKFKVSKEIPRGTKPVVIDFTPKEPGRYPILCSEYCGDGHDDMTGTLVVLARAESR